MYLDNHRVLDASQGLHLRQGYSVSSQASQGHQPQKEQTIEPDLQEQLQAARLEKEIQKAVMKHYKVLQRDFGHEQHHPPPRHGQNTIGHRNQG